MRSSTEPFPGQHQQPQSLLLHSVQGTGNRESRKMQVEEERAGRKEENPGEQGRV